ncbi:hypothetical protein ElyMa_001668600, partial [Elysia marginata]
AAIAVVEAAVVVAAIVVVVAAAAVIVVAATVVVVIVVIVLLVIVVAAAARGKRRKKRVDSKGRKNLRNTGQNNRQQMDLHWKQGSERLQWRPKSNWSSISFTVSIEEQHS